MAFQWPPLRPIASYKDEGLRLLRERGVVKAIGVFSGGNDEGGVESFTLYRADGIRYSLQRLYGDYVFDTEERKWVTREVTPEIQRDAELYTLLEMPVDLEYGSFSGEFFVHGEVIWDVETGTVKMLGQEENRSWHDFEEEYD